MSGGSKHRVFIGFTEVAGYYRGLERCLRAAGIQARFFDLSRNPFRYGMGAGATTRRRAVPRHALSRGRPAYWLRVMQDAWQKIWGATRRLLLLPWAVLRYDVFVFSGADSFFGYRDLPVLRRLGKRIVYVFNGSDHRPPYLNGRSVRLADELGIQWLIRETERIRRRVLAIERSATAIVASGASAQFHRRPFVQYLALGLPLDLREVVGPTTHPGAWRGHGVKVVHSPSDPVGKGTALVREAVSAIQAEGLAIDYLEVIDRPNAEVLARIRECDLVVDQVYSDTPMAHLAAEAAWLGKPTLVGGYYAAEEPDLPSDAVPPSCFVHPQDLIPALRRLVGDPALRLDLGRRARLYAESRWAPAEVGRRFIQVIDGEIPEAWTYDPRSITYVRGWGMPEEALRLVLNRMLRSAGGDSLQLEDHPDLKSRTMQFAVDSPPAPYAAKEDT